MRDNQPDDRRNRGRDQRRLGENHGRVARERHLRQRNRCDERGDHRGNLAPSIDAPPIPSQHQHAAGARAHAEQKLPRRLNRSDVRRSVAAQNHEQHDEKLADGHVMLFRSFANDKAPVKIVDEVRRAPVELRADGGHERRQKRRDHQPANCRRKKIAQHHDVAFFGLGRKFRAWMQTAMR